ncbi:NAD-dependent protein deacylase Sirt4-like [Tetranychus urticae]|uniref:Deacetylase sirtuin-type domain-containing protein n=1 Tax=Tetranychus urticae TaxID=32264 RepID=T1L486_TETUR|nr:NAD-dependent protein deacylase Sirt4-like [Tetranychus urticae]
MSPGCWNLSTHLSRITSRRLSSLIGSFEPSYNPNFVPEHSPVEPDDIRLLTQFMKSHSNIIVITGAGISTESGVPDYRSEKVGLYARNNHKPIQYQEFLSSQAVRLRYWARNFIGFDNFSKIRPNNAHYILSKWERQEKIKWIVTQNVDQLHQKAGSLKVTELHGSGFTVKCLNSRNSQCDFTISRHIFQEVLHQYNPQLVDVKLDDLRTVRPDGDVDLDARFVENFKVPRCPKCLGILKPDIIFFGDTVPKDRVEYIYQKMDKCDALLVIGSSLQVYSAYRYIIAASEKSLPIMLINIGASRADNLKNVTIVRKRAGQLLPLIEISS